MTTKQYENPGLTELPAYKELENHFKLASKFNIRELFENEENRNE